MNIGDRTYTVDVEPIDETAPVAIEVPPRPVTDEDIRALPVLDLDEFAEEIAAR